jgi:hypothetical protein
MWPSKAFFYLILILVLCPENLSAQALIDLNFEGDEVGKFPSGWSSRDKENMIRVYTVQTEGANKFLHADSRGISVQIGYEKKWELNHFPSLRWRWRAQTFPEGTNEREKSGNDNVLAVYVVFGGWPIPSSIKYVWSDTLPVGEILDSPHSSKTKVVVVRSGRSMIGKWVTEERNVLADYRSIFGEEEKNPAAKGIALLTDSDNTNTRAVGDYGEITIFGKGGR